MANLTKAKRKHPGIDIIAESSQGRQLLGIIRGLVGPDPGYQPVASTSNGAHLFWVEGEHGNGMLVVGREEIAAGQIIEPFGFLFKPALVPGIIHVELEAFRWDPGVHAEHVHDDSVLKLSPKKRSALRDKMSQELGDANDRLRMFFVPVEEAPQTIAGVELSLVISLHLELLDSVEES